jgi:hypothetical protein
MARLVGFGAEHVFAHLVPSSSATHQTTRLGGGVYQHRHGVGARRYSQIWHRTPRQPDRIRHAGWVYLVFGGRWAASLTDPTPFAVCRYRLGPHSSRLSFERVGRYLPPQPGATARPTHHALSVVRAWVVTRRGEHPHPFFVFVGRLPYGFVVGT